ncbi:MAG: hypothetical protein V1791_05275, partial [Pseudomonadota bacterium]
MNNTDLWKRYSSSLCHCPAIGLSLDTAAVKAGGFLSIKPEEYIGALELEIKAIKLAVNAIAIINT